METPSQPTEDFGEPVDFPLWPHQVEAVYRCDQYRLVFEIGGRGSGKTYKDAARIIRWAEMCTELAIGIFAPTDTMLTSALAPVMETLDAMGIQYVDGPRTPPEWIEQWKRDGIKVPPPRRRGDKFLVLETGAHIYTGTLINGAYTRAKGIDFNAVLFVEATEPGVTLLALMTLFGGCRCGAAKRGKDGVWRCSEPNHLHQLVYEGNVPLNDPSHFVYKKNEQLQAQEDARRLAGEAPFYRLLTSSTRDNPATGQGYDDGLRLMFDGATYIEQTAGKLTRNKSLLTYYSFDDRNILDSLTYDPNRPLFMWFDWNATPASVGWGHDLRWDEVPEPERQPGHHPFGIIGELFSGADPMTTDRVAAALLAHGSPTGDCAESACHHPMAQHVEMHNGHLCGVCAWRVPGMIRETRHCSGKTMKSSLEPDTASKYIHAPGNWRGLMRHRAMIHVYGDANDGGVIGSSVGGGSKQIIRDAFESALGDRVTFHFGASNPRIKHRLIAVNRGFRDATECASVFVARHCDAHITDFREVIPDPKTGEPLKVSKAPSARKAGNDYWLRTDISDAWGYHWHARHPYIRPGSDGYPLGQGDEYEGPNADGWARA